MKYSIINIIFMSIATFACGTFFEAWWLFLIPVFLLGYYMRNDKRPMVSGGLGAGLAWGIFALYKDSLNNSILSTKIASMFGLPGSFSLIAITTLVGAILGSLAGGCGSAMAGKVLNEVKKK